MFLSPGDWTRAGLLGKVHKRGLVYHLLSLLCLFQVLESNLVYSLQVTFSPKFPSIA